MASCTDGGGSTTSCGGEDHGTGEPAREATGNHVKMMRTGSGIYAEEKWRQMVRWFGFYLRVDLAGSEDERRSCGSLGAHGQARLRRGG